ncbi:hypothetical protein LCGC14_1102430, partial [marine sediment metagenome]
FKDMRHYNIGKRATWLNDEMMRGVKSGLASQ